MTLINYEIALLCIVVACICGPLLVYLCLRLAFKSFEQWPDLTEPKAFFIIGPSLIALIVAVLTGVFSITAIGDLAFFQYSRQFFKMYLNNPF
jgi:hypothetical protein